MISRILIIASGGLLCYSKSFLGKSAIDDDLVSGFLTAISNFAREIKGGEIKALNFRNFNFIYDYDNELDVMFVLVTDIDDLEEEAQEKVQLLRREFIRRFRDTIENWTGDISQFQAFDEFAENNIFIPPKILLVGEDGVGKTTIMNLFPGETVLELDEDLNEIIQKPINVSGINIKQFILREIELEELVENSKLYRPLLNSVDVICIVSNSAASNLGRTKKLFSILKQKVKKADFYIIANFQDMKDSAFEPEKIEAAFGVKTFGLSAISQKAQSEIFNIMLSILKKSIIEKIEKKQQEITE
ncbi:MAG: ADP-ribosylation factor-like protein [Promethearchaeota archaeon]